MERGKVNRKASITAISMLLACSCAPGERSHFFKNTDDLRKSDVYSRWAPDFIPVDARNIEVWYDQDTSLVRVQFLHSGGESIKGSDMKLLDHPLMPVAISSYPNLQTKEKIVAIYYGCEMRTIAPDHDPSQKTTFIETSFVADAGGTIYYWNSHMPSIFEEVCGSFGGSG